MPEFINGVRIRESPNGDQGDGALTQDYSDMRRATLDLGAPATEGELFVAYFGTIFTLADPGPTLYVDGAVRDAYSVTAHSPQSLVRVWIGRAHAGERFLQVVVPTSSSNAAGGAFRVPGDMLDEPWPIAVQTRSGFGQQGMPAWDDDGEGIALAFTVSQTNIKVDSIPPAGWWLIDLLTAQSVTVGVFGFRMTGAGAQGVQMWGSSVGDGVVALLRLHEVGHHLASSRLFDETAGIPVAGSQVAEPTPGVRPAADQPGFPLPPAPRPIVVPTEAHRLGRYPT